jgi:hypothetical protein
MGSAPMKPKRRQQQDKLLDTPPLTKELCPEKPIINPKLPHSQM